MGRTTSAGELVDHLGARGYYEDSYDLEALAERVLRPLGPGGSRRYAVRVHDLVTDAEVDDEVAVAPRLVRLGLGS